MDFNVGDRIHVTRFRNEEVDFYATLSFMGIYNFEINNCTNKDFNNKLIAMSDTDFFGKYKECYYTLAIDEEDSEEPEVQHISGKNYLNTQFVVEVNKGVYVQKIKGNTFKFTKNIEEALFFSYYFESIADDIVEQLNGKKYEVVRYMEG